MNLSEKTLLIVTGPTASGKTSYAIELAQRLQTEIISADSRQVYKHMPIVTAAPSAAQLAAVRHHLVAILEPEQSYSAAAFDADVSRLLPQIWSKTDTAIICGGSMMYIDAFVNGLDNLPDIPDELRNRVWKMFYDGGLDELHRQLRHLDPSYLETADRSNHKRLIHAIEVSLQAGVPYSSLLTGERREHPFRILKVAPSLSREELFSRIGRRIDAMVESGLVEEARELLPYRGLNSLNTVGLKEMFSYFDGDMTLPQAIEKIARNTRVYAKKQQTWLRRNPTVNFLPAEDFVTETLKLLGTERSR